jgi:hypothetical protein
MIPKASEWKLSNGKGCSPTRALHWTPGGRFQFRLAVHGFRSGVCEFFR